MRPQMRTLALLLAATFAATTLWGRPSASAGHREEATSVAQRSEPTETLPAGNEAVGAAIVAGKGACQTCHRVRDQGSRLGPDLTDIGAVRSPEQLQTSLLDPDAEILPENRFYRVVTRDGATITGRLLNLDTFQVLMMGPKEELRSFYKSELREHGFIKGSTMPSYRNTLSRQELADVITYLSTLKGVTP
jgi:putative heme-binding domain-containing protein